MKEINIILLLIALFLLVIPLVSASQISFNEYEMNKISDLIVKDCKSYTFLYICHNTKTIEDLGMKGDCIDYGLNLDSQNEIIAFGELQKYYGGQLINLNASEGKEGALYSVRVDKIKKEQINRYFSFLNNDILVNYGKDFPFIGCYIDNSTMKIKELTVDETNQKFWDGKLIKEPRSILNITIQFTLIGFGISFSIISITFFTILIKRRKIILFNKYVFTYNKEVNISIKNTTKIK